MKKERINELLNKSNYGSFLGFQCDREVKELEFEKKEYQELLKLTSSEKLKIDSQNNFVLSQIHSLDYALNSHNRIKLSETKPTEEHIKLLKRMTFEDLDGGECVFIGVNGKRPFGNSDIYNDVAEILEWELPNDDLSSKQQKRASILLEELPFVLNKIIEELT